MKEWLDDHKYFDLTYSIDHCGTRSIIIRCENDFYSSHEYISRLYCSSILCPRCGSERSKAHRRRIHRSYEKLAWLTCMGTATLTVPHSLRHIDLGVFFKMSSKFLMRYLDLEGCLGYFHPVGDKLKGIHPHIHFLFPIEEKRKHIPKRKLQAMGKKWSEVLQKKFPEAELPGNVRVHYQYKDNDSVIATSVGYHSRKSFINPIEFNEQTSEVKHYLANLKGRRLVRGYGVLSDRKCKEFIAYTRLLNGREFEDQKLRTLGSVLAMKICPVCGEKLKYAGRYDGVYRTIDYGELIEVVPDLFVKDYLAEEIREKWGTDTLN